MIELKIDTALATAETGAIDYLLESQELADD
jgi:hypothetical protein